MKGTKLYSIFKGKCPRCHEGDFFVEKHPYKLSKMAHIHKECSVCGENFEREPGFYFGAAYVSYGLTVALWVAVLVALLTFDALGWIEYGFYENPVTLLVTGIITLLAFLPVLYRGSRIIWLNIFVKYKRPEERAKQA